MREEIIRDIRRDDLRVPLIEKRKSAPRRANIYRLPQAVEHQHLTVQ